MENVKMELQNRMAFLSIFPVRIWKAEVVVEYTSSLCWIALDRLLSLDFALTYLISHILWHSHEYLNYACWEKIICLKPAAWSVLSDLVLAWEIASDFSFFRFPQISHLCIFSYKSKLFSKLKHLSLSHQSLFFSLFLF